MFLARNLESSDFSVYNAAIGMITLIQIPAVAIQTAITKKVASNRNFNLTKFKRDSTIQLILIALCVSLLFYLLGNQISAIANIPSKYILPLTVVVFGSIISPTAKGFLLGLEKILAFNIVTLVETVLKFVFGCIAIYLNTDVSLPILSFTIPSILTFMLILPFVKTGKDLLPKENIKLDYKNISLIFLTFVLLNIPFTVDLILVNPEFRPAYGALALMGKIVYFGSITIASVMLSRLANSKHSSRKKTLLISLLVSGFTGVCISVVYALFPNEIVDIVFKGQYLEIVGYIVPYSIVMIGYALAYMVITSLLVEDSYIHIYFLLLLSILQVILYRINNSSLHDAVNNQLVIYGILSIFVFLILIFYIFKKNAKNIKEKTK